MKQSPAFEVLPNISITGTRDSASQNDVNGSVRPRSSSSESSPPQRHETEQEQPNNAPLPTISSPKGTSKAAPLNHSRSVSEFQTLYSPSKPNTNNIIPSPISDIPGKYKTNFSMSYDSPGSPRQHSMQPAYSSNFFHLDSIPTPSHTPVHTSPLEPRLSPKTRVERTNSAGNKVIGVLITECIQKDFLGSIQPREALPNALHVGFEESVRLLGPDPMIGPFSRLITWARHQAMDTLYIIHIRDWHNKNPTDPEEIDHLKRFGLHCIQNTPGAELILGIGDEVPNRQNETFVNVIGMNDFESSNLEALLRNIGDKAKEAQAELRIGVVGVWTEAKLTFLLYELKTRMKFSRLGTCSALTAGSSRLQHFNALDQLKRLFGVTVTESVSEFTDWLVPKGTSLSDYYLQSLSSKNQVPDPSCVPSMLSINRTLKIKGPFVPRHRDLVEHPELLSEEDRALLNFLYRSCSSVELEKLSGGFSGALVLKVTAVDSLGHKLPPNVVKLGPTKLISREMANFERVEAVLGNNAPRVQGYVDLCNRAGIKFAFASMTNVDKVQTFERMYKSSGVSQHTINSLLTCVFEDILGRFYMVSQFEPLVLLECYDFNGRGWASFKGGTDTPSLVRERVSMILGCDPNTEYLEFPGGYKFRNVADFLEFDLAKIPRRSTECHFVSYVHGDLNSNNILVDANNNVWLIDFFYTDRTHVLKDTSKLENDIFLLLNTVHDENELLQGLAILSYLSKITDLGQRLPEDLPGVTSPNMVRAWKSIRKLREITVNLVKYDRHPLQLSIPLLRYALHNLCLGDLGDIREWKLQQQEHSHHQEHQHSKHDNNSNSLAVSGEHWKKSSDNSVQSNDSVSGFDLNYRDTSDDLGKHSIRSATINKDIFTVYSRQLSLAAACVHADLIRSTYLKEQSELIIHWFLRNQLKTRGKLGITLLPGRKDKGRDLETDLATLKKENVNCLVCLVQPIEFQYSSVPSLEEKAKEKGMSYLHAPLNEQTLPLLSKVYQTVDWIIGQLKDGKNVVVFDRAGLGRAGTITACVLLASEGGTAAQAIETVRAVRGTNRAIEKKVQEMTIDQFAKSLEAKFFRKKLNVQNF